MVLPGMSVLCRCARVRRWRSGPLGLILTLSGLFTLTWLVSMLGNTDILDRPAIREVLLLRSDMPERQPVHTLPIHTDPDVATRHITVRERCSKLRQGGIGKNRQTSGSLPRFPMSPVISSTHKPQLFYCPLAKAGSTFFTRYMIAAASPGPMVSPFNISIKDAKRDSLQSFQSLRTVPERQTFLKNSFRFLFTRNPYSRIFSAYIDKLYSPNPYYWSEWGVAAVKLYNLPPQAHPCGTNVSFRDFIKALVAKLHHRDMHFIAMTQMCRVCDVEWDMVGQVEHSVPDLDFLSEKINVTSAFQHRAGYSADNTNDVIVDSTTDVFTEWLDDIKNCMNVFDAGRIIWRKLQIRGIIYKDSPFPFSREDMDSMTVIRFQDACRRAAADATDKTRLKKQKSDAISQAFSTVDLKDLEKLRSVYKTDFFLFGYDPNPSYILDITQRRQEAKILDWRENWT
ncbi:carbohydrate sulfotransferase [Plakobranchus ocellatus]|uniref:Carbohydrate sulfotransferase n=1 Tax=Plakobranchus ocellatus TaxID=259542 RepID=A0AAV4DXJ9_9GAST|nr:carbohydrate sulfotransferase [Plakobranchus ocellatus]